MYYYTKPPNAEHRTEPPLNTFGKIWNSMVEKRCPYIFHASCVMNIFGTMNSPDCVSTRVWMYATLWTPIRRWILQEISNPFHSKCFHTGECNQNIASSNKCADVRMDGTLLKMMTMAELTATVRDGWGWVREFAHWKGNKNHTNFMKY